MIDPFVEAVRTLHEAGHSKQQITVALACLLSHVDLALAVASVTTKKGWCLDDRQIAIAKGMLARGDKNHTVANYFGINQGRIADINQGRRGALVEAAPAHELPPPNSGTIAVENAALRNYIQHLRQSNAELNKRLESLENAQILATLVPNPQPRLPELLAELVQKHGL